MSYQHEIIVNNDNSNINNNNIIIIIIIINNVNTMELSLTSELSRNVFNACFRF